MNTSAILVINPGSTSTRLALYEGDACLADQNLACSAAELAACGSWREQLPLRSRQAREFLAGQGRAAGTLAAIVARGGPLQAVPGGVYRVNAALLADARSDRFVDHVSRLACILAAELAAGSATPVFIVDPVSTDEYDPVARISGLPELPRKSLTHALNLKAVARRFAREQGRPYAELNLITAQLAGGLSIAVHCRGRMIDSVDANGEGPFSAERSGGLRADDLVRLAAQDKGDRPPLGRRLTRQGGLVGHLGTHDGREVERRIAAGDESARLVYQALAYGVAKHICGLAAAVNGRVDGIVLTGGLAHSTLLTGWIAERVRFLAAVRVIPGELEMEALAQGAQRALLGEERVKVYPTGEFEVAGGA